MEGPLLGYERALEVVVTERLQLDFGVGYKFGDLQFSFDLTLSCCGVSFFGDIGLQGKGVELHELRVVNMGGGLHLSECTCATTSFNAW